MGRPVEHHLAVVRLVKGRRVDVMKFEHAVEDHVAPFPRRLRMHHRVEGGRVFHQAGQQRRLRQGELVDVDVEVVLRGYLDAVRAIAEVGDVEITLEDLVLTQMGFEVQRITRFPKLALDGLLGRGLLRLGRRRGHQKNVLDVLLGQGRAALGDLAVLPVGEIRPDETLVIQPVVLVEPGILDVDDRLTHHRRNAAQGHDLAVLLPAQHGEDVPPRVEDARRLGQRGDSQVGRQVEEVVRAALDGQSGRPHHRQGQHADEHARHHADHTGAEQPRGHEPQPAGR